MARLEDPTGAGKPVGSVVNRSRSQLLHRRRTAHSCIRVVIRGWPVRECDSCRKVWQKTCAAAYVAEKDEYEFTQVLRKIYAEFTQLAS